MLYLKNALGGIGRSVSCTARLAFAHAGGAARWRKFALYAAMFVLPGGSIAVVLMMWVDRRRAQRDAAPMQAPASSTPPAMSDALSGAATITTAAAVTTTVAIKAPCSGVQVACRAASTSTTRGTRTRAGTAALHAVHALRRWRSNDA
jgi:hypothetical protein